MAWIRSQGCSFHSVKTPTPSQADLYTREGVELNSAPTTIARDGKNPIVTLNTSRSPVTVILYYGFPPAVKLFWEPYRGRIAV